MPISVHELTQIPYLRTRIIAGEGGAGKAIGWAHSVEIPNPWDWLEPGDLVMTVGLGIPAETELQVEYVTRLAALGVSGVAIGENMEAPPLSREMLAAADEVDLPLMWTAFEVPFSQISRAVAASNHDAEYGRLLRSMRVYDLGRQAVAQRYQAQDLIAALETEIGCTLYVCEHNTGVAALDGVPEPPAELVEALLSDAGEQGGSPGLRRAPIVDGVMLIVDVPTRLPVSLLVVPGQGEAPGYAILQHVATIAALEVERLRATREERRRLGAEAFAQLIEHGRPSETVAEQLVAQGLTEGPFVVAAVASPDASIARSGQLHQALAGRRVPHLLLRRGDTLYALLPSSEGAVEVLVEGLGEERPVGLSLEFSQFGDVARAAEEARWARDAATVEQRSLVRYGDERMLLGPRSLDEARAAVDRILGPVIAHDQQNGGELMGSLDVFLANNRSWQKAAKELFVHKQTLVYRMSRVEQLSGRRLNQTAGVAELWMAVEAWKRLTRQPLSDSDTASRGRP